MGLTLIAAVAENGVIGNKGTIPWMGRIPGDLRRFKKLTLDHDVIMGRLTYESIITWSNKPLVNRRNIVLSSQQNYEVQPGVVLARSLEAALRETSSNPVYIIGGEKLYSQAMPYADAIELTRIHERFKGDVFFPYINHEEWKETWREDYHSSSPPYSFITLERINK